MSDKRFPWVSVLSLGAIAVLFAISFVLGSPRPMEAAQPDQAQTQAEAPEPEEGFVGTDSVVVDIMDKAGAEPWFSPLFEPASGEIESGLFALQAAIGAGIVGYAFGALRGRSAERAKQASKAE
ncbi:energy-coupling factor ABC transporter substrate-binding protein [Tessaracoccus sp. OH4464_COT-324]|uniref:energy-coupling factor ABC transporter substrate-binding protein n=1 Tax=Tessaracoccus sp. OH4464_COT-324 TaxID=2491059 RepID=UPI000F635456|nr:energy-coupling factor ABC transporter substrate-binding protein [Tessaracoccus sp. OH4464_COT-324]RRD45993.1 energy-coupling factor ABC transporter substrate-binding protein [Tessaracoccus sp. OH4464_COT-324]